MNIFHHLILINLPYAVVTNNVVIISSAFNSCTTKVFRLVPDNLKNQMKMRNTRQKKQTRGQITYIHVSQTLMSNVSVLVFFLSNILLFFENYSIEIVENFENKLYHIAFYLCVVTAHPKTCVR